MKVFVTGGAGFIGSHTCVELLNAGHQVVVVDNLCNSCEESLERVKKITGKAVKFYEADIRDERRLDEIVSLEAPFDATIHFAALKAVGESLTSTQVFLGSQHPTNITLISPNRCLKTN